MTRRHLTYCFVLIAATLTAHKCLAQTIHPYGIAQMLTTTDNDLIGTTRFVGMAGAMTAVGGDPIAAKINPAGLGVYRHSQFSVSADGTFSRFWQQGNIDKGELYRRWRLSQMSYVFALTHPERLTGLVSNNLMVSYTRRADILNHVRLNDMNTRPSDALNWIETTLDESGYRHNVDVHYAMNISNRVYWGVGMTVEWLQARQTVSHLEYVASDRRGQTHYYLKDETAIGKSVGWGASAGVLVHPIQALRIGVSVESPIIGKMRETDYYSEHISYPGAADKSQDFESPTYNYSWQMTTPLKASAGLGLQWKSHGLLSLQYDLQYHRLAGVSHTARVGLEAAMTNHWMLDAGYAYNTLYSRQYATVGLHYMGNWLRIGIAYAFSWRKAMVNDAVYGLQQGVVKTTENKIVFTFQWNS